MNTPLPRWVDLGLIPALNVIAAFLVAGLVVMLIGENPIDAVRFILIGAFGFGEGLGGGGVQGAGAAALPDGDLAGGGLQEEAAEGFGRIVARAQVEGAVAGQQVRPEEGAAGLRHALRVGGAGGGDGERGGAGRSANRAGRPKAATGSGTSRALPPVPSADVARVISPPRRANCDRFDFRGC